MRRVLVAAVAVLGTGVGVLIACGPGDLSDLTRGERATAGEAGVDDSGLPPIPRCKGAVAPDRPTGTSPTSGAEQTFAFDNLRIDSRVDSDASLPPPPGLNLDDNCSCEKDFSCEPPDGGDRKKLCDEKEGRDNAMGALLADLSILAPTFRPAFMKQRIDDGAFSVILSMLDWNGEPNDDRVFVGFRMATGIENGIDAGIPVMPRHDGTDIWSVDPGSLVNAPPVGTACTPESCLPLTLDDKAYVADNKLVAHFPTIKLALSAGSGRVVLPFDAVTLVADLSRATIEGNEVLRMDGQLVGRWSTSSLLAAAGSFSPETADQFQSLCKNDLAYALFKEKICTSADLAATPAEDNRRGARCTALSEAVHFTAVTARLGATRPPEETEGSCRPTESCP